MDNKNIDKKIDEALQQCFDAQEHTAPPNLWDSIAMSLDGEELLDNKLKETQEAVVDTAPAGLWAGIVSGLDAAAEIDTTIDAKVKASDAQQPIQPAPTAAWDAIEKQLNLNQTWENIATALPKEGTPIVSKSANWRKYTTRLGAAAMLLLLLRACIGDNWTTENPVMANQSATQNSIPPITNTIKTQQNTSQTQNSGIAAIPNKQQENNTTKIAVATASAQSNQTALYNSNSTKKDKRAMGGELLSTKKAIAKNKFEKNKENFPNLPTYSNQQTSLGQEKVIKQEISIIATGIDKNTSNEEKSFSITGIDVISKKDFPLDMVLPIEEFEVLDNTLEVEPSPLAGKLSVGVFAVFNATTLLNEETREGIRGSNRVQNSPRFAANYGIWVGYQFLPKSSIIAEFSINADNRQAYRIVEDRVAYTKEWVMKYNRISLAYQHDLMQTTGKHLQSRVTAQGGIYLGMLRQAKLFYDGELFFDAIADHHQFDFGFKLALGQELVFGKFVVGYGIRSDIGATNIFRGNVNFSAQENRTNLIQLGGYVSLGYRF